MLGERLKWIRKDKGLTQQSLAKPLSTSSGYISEVEQGKKSPGSDFLLSLMRVYRISIDWLLNGEGEPYLTDIDPGTALESTIGFNDKIYALDIYRDLTELKRLDPEAFRRVETYIKATIDTLREVAEKSSVNRSDRRQKDRRVKNDPGKAPAGRDRRKGKDRRKAGANG